MAKYKYAITEEKIARFEKEGRGKGEGKDYQPWLTIADVPSQGRHSRPFSLKTNRTHELLSDIENGAFHLYNWSDKVTDIREQYPLDRSITQRIAREMGITHPADPKTGCDIVLTTDLLITVSRNDQFFLLARSVKAHDAFDRRTLDKQEIERRYWQEESADWGIITQQQLPEPFVTNLRWAHEFIRLDYLDELYVGYWNDRCQRLIEYLSQRSGIKISAMIEELEQSHGFAMGHVINVIRHFIATKQLAMDMNQEWSVNRDISTLYFADETQGKQRHAIG